MRAISLSVACVDHAVEAMQTRPITNPHVAKYIGLSKSRLVLVQMIATA